jgi:putative SOS response-associated peptidase YedK
MPVILKPEDFDARLDPKQQDAEQITALLRALDEQLMISHAVSKLVNNPRHEKPECVRPIVSR